MDHDPIVWWLYGIGVLAGLFQTSQIIEDVLLLYCISCEFTTSRTALHAAFCAIVAMMYLSFRSISVAATLFFVFCIRDPSSTWLNYLVILNTILYFPSRFIGLGGGLLRALETTRHERIDPKKVEVSLTSISVQLPMTLVIVPCHREPLAAVLASVNSVAHSIYTHNRIHIFLSFDGPQNMDIFTELVAIIGARKNNVRQFPCAETNIGNAQLTVCLFEHGGKGRCQDHTLKYIKRYHHSYFQSMSDTCVLLLDSDTTLHRSALWLLATRLQHPPSEKPNRLVALSCVQGISQPSWSLLAAIQEVEYLRHGVLFEVSMSMLGNVTCLSGTVVYVRLAALLAVYGNYFQDSYGQTVRLSEHWKRSFGEDRHLTQRLVGKFGPWSTDIHTGTVSETRPAIPLRGLIMQRRRWFLGTVATEAAALCKAEFWRSTPFLSAYRLCVKPVSVEDSQMILLVIATSQLQLESFAWISRAVASLLLMDILVLLSFDALRNRICNPMIWALVTVWERIW